MRTIAVTANGSVLLATTSAVPARQVGAAGRPSEVRRREHACEFRQRLLGHLDARTKGVKVAVNSTPASCNRRNKMVVQLQRSLVPIQLFEQRRTVIGLRQPSDFLEPSTRKPSP